MRALLCLLAAVPALSILVNQNLKAGCNGQGVPGQPNLNPIDMKAPVFVRQVKNAKLYTVGQGEHAIDLVHLWGTPYEMGFAMGTIMPQKLEKFIAEVYRYVENEVIKGAANNTFLAFVAKIGLDIALDLSFAATEKYIKPYVMEEIKGMADASQGRINVTDIRNVMWLGELTRGACSMFGAWGEATKLSRNGNLLQLRALDWDVDGPFKNYPALVVYHPNAGEGYDWVNVGFTGWTASITGMSSKHLSISEIGVSYPDSTFGPETYLAPGYPFGFILRDILQFDTSLDDAIHRIQGATRTCDLILGVGDGTANAFRGFQYSPNVANVMDDTNLKPEAPWHPKIKDVVYWGMDWMCPNDNTMLSHQLNLFHGNISVANTIRDITSYVTTGDLHIAIYDHADSAMYVATARKDGGTGPLQAYQRPFVRVNVAALWTEQRPAAEAETIQV